MGLDMYISAERYVSGYDHNSEERQKQYRVILEASGLEDVASNSTPSLRVSVTVAYWRKANAIHRWFVENVQNGEDDCGRYYVPRETLQELRDLCQKMLDTADVAGGQPVVNGFRSVGGGPLEPNIEEGRAALNGEELAEILPTQSGFFFGSTDYDQWYLQDIEDTVRQIDQVLSNLPDGVPLYYSSSW